MNCLLPLQTGVVGWNPTQGMDVCERLFCVCVVLCVGSGLATGWSPLEGALSTVYWIKKLKKRPSPTKGCRAIERQIQESVINYKRCGWEFFSIHSLSHHFQKGCEGHSAFCPTCIGMLFSPGMIFELETNPSSPFPFCIPTRVHCVGLRCRLSFF
jgi:hypothetical protein